MNGASRLGTSLTSTLAATLKASPKLGKTTPISVCSSARFATTATSGAFYQEPRKVPMGISGVAATITTGLLLGAGISKNIASFLEENELFVPSDDDDDD